MPTDSPPDTDDDRSSESDTTPGPWELTLEDLRTLETSLEADGWDVIATQAGHTSPMPPDSGASDRAGFVMVLPGETADQIVAAIETGQFEEYDVFHRGVGDRMYVVVQYRSPTSTQAVLLAGSYRFQYLEPVREAAAADGGLEIRLKRLDGTHVGSFYHEEYEQFFLEKS